MSSQSDCAVLPAFPGPQSDTDAFNTAEARINFGPTRSPEKTFPSIIARTPTCTTDLASEPSSSAATLDQPPSSQSTTNMETGDPKQSEVTMEKDVEAGESHMNDTHGTPVSDIASQEITETRESLERETNALASLSIVTDEPMNSDREQSPVSESSATDTMAVVDALVPDSPLTPRSSTFSKQAPVEIPPIDLTPREDDNAESSTLEGVQTPKPSNPQIPPTTRDTHSEQDVATPRAEMATPTRPRPPVLTPTTIDRELKSLSPTSNHLLGQLLATPERSPRRLPIHGSEDKQVGPSTSRQTATMPFPRPPMSLETPQRTPRPFPSPLRSAKASSPVRPPPPEGAAESRSSNMPGPSTAKSIFARTGTDKLPPGSPLKSPVRRAVGLPATGLISPQKSIPSKIPATSARSNAATAKGVDRSSPVKGADGPKIRANAPKAALGASSTSSTTTTTTTTKSLSRSTSTKPLPFPIGPVRTVPRRGTTPGTESSSDVEPPSSQPAKYEAPKSSLKQSASSKIPRPKPYARPAAATRRTLANRRAPDHERSERSSSNEDSTQVQTPATEPPQMPQEPAVPAPVPAPAEPTLPAPIESSPEPAPPAIIQPLAEPAPPAATESLPEPAPPAPIQSSIFSAPSTLTPNPTFTIAPLSPLKRKRPSEEASDTEIQPITKSESRRQVKIPKLIEEETPATTQPQPARLISRRQPVVTEPVRTLDEELAAAVASSDPPESYTPAPDALPSSSPPSSPAELSNEEPRSDDRPLQSANSSPDVPPIAAYPEVPRRTRTRRTLDLSGDGTGSSTSRTARRRLGTHLVPPSDNFCGLSAIALKALTTQNTTRNEKYIMTKLETELVKKDGLRPDSPGIKAKTTLQRQQEELQKQRQERAERRARRGGEGSDARQDLLDEVDEGDGISDEEEEEESEMLDSTPSKPRHMRGAGDDEDYETPIRPSARRKGSGETDEDNDRRVRWDRGLFTEVCLDEVKFGTRKRDNLVASKGCLAPKAKALPLDNLGNLPDAASPWADIEQEQVIIKRFVYENDESTAPVPEPVPVVKPVTRQRSKKAKS